MRDLPKILHRQKRFSTRTLLLITKRLKTMRTHSKIVTLADHKKKMERRKYADLVMKIWNDQEHAEKRKFLDRKGEVQIKARERL